MQKRACLGGVVVGALVLVGLSTTAWGGPPSPPVIDVSSIPPTPVGGPEVSVATAVAIAAYGLWRSSR